MDELKWQDISLRIKKLRVANKITIERLSEIIGVSSSFIGLVERGDSGISIENLYKISQVFDVSVDYLLTGFMSNSDKTVSKFDKLNATIFDYSEQEIAFLIDFIKFLKPRINVKLEAKQDFTKQ